MALTLNISSGVVDLGETKTLQVTPKDAAGDAFSPATLTAVFTPPSGDTTTYNKGDFTDTSSVFTVNHTFDEVGVWAVKVTAVDGSGNIEIDADDVRVRQ